MSSSLELQELQRLENTCPSSRQYCAEIKAAAQRGNILAHFQLGNWSYTGLWDVKAMRDDLLIGNFTQSTEDPFKDPYLIIPKNPQQALQYWNYAEQHCPLHLHPDLALLQRSRTELLAVSFKSSVTNKPFIRPRILRNSLFQFFKRSAEGNSSAYKQVILHQALLTHTIPLLGGMNGLWIIGFVVLVIDVPCLFFIWFINHYGRDRGLPLCSCSASSEGHQLILQRLPEAKPDFLFSNPSCFIRKSLSLFGAYYGALLLLSILGIAFRAQFKANAPEDCLVLPLLGIVDEVKFIFGLSLTIFASICLLLYPNTVAFIPNHPGCNAQLQEEKQPIIIGVKDDEGAKDDKNVK